MRRRPVPAACLGLAVACGLAGPARAQAEAAPAGGSAPLVDALPSATASARQVIERAFDNFYQHDVRAVIEFKVRQGDRVMLEYDTELLRKFIDGRAHDLFYFEGDSDRRGMRVLRVEQLDREDDTFVYLPQLRRIRRGGTAQRADKFLGMEVTLEDLEVQRLEKFEILGRSSARVDGEAAHLVTLKRLVKSGYDRVDFFVATRDPAILEVRFYRPGALEPYKVTRMPRDSMQHYGSRVLPREIEFLDRETGTATTIVYRRREVNPDLPAERFSSLSLEKRLRLSQLQPWRDEAGAPPPVGAALGH
jgi:hypothetical protein